MQEHLFNMGQGIQLAVIAETCRIKRDVLRELTLESVPTTLRFSLEHVNRPVVLTVSVFEKPGVKKEILKLSVRESRLIPVPELPSVTAHGLWVELLHGEDIEFYRAINFRS